MKINCNNTRNLSYVSAGISLVVAALSAMLFAAILYIYKDKSREEEFKHSGLGKIPYTTFVFALIKSLAVVVTTMLLVYGIKMNRTKFMSPFFWAMGVFIITWTMFAVITFIMAVIHKAPLGGAIVEFIIIILILSAECLLMIAPVKLYQELKARPFNIHHQAATSHNSEYTPSFQS